MRNRYEAQTFEADPLDGYNSKSEKQKVSIHSVSWIAAITFILLVVLSFAAMKSFNGLLPKPLRVSDEKSNPDAFIAERAIHDLQLLTGLGPRVTGSYENEILAIDFFKREIAFIQQHSHQNQKVEADFQTVSGSFFLDFKPNGAINAYSKVQNIVVKLHGKSSSHSLLLNSHFDTVATSPGGSDDGINCAIMLEILRKLSRSKERLQHDVIFLFNGAEEAVLKGAHGFIMNHKWTNEIRVVLNLEAAGAGGKEYLFQSSNNHPWILNYYKQVPHPSGHVFGEELFQRGIIPSDTDYRIFRDFKNITGLDFAFVNDGYRYHTKYDNFSNIPHGSYQHVGDNILKLTRLIGNAPELSESEKVTEKTVYFDFFGCFVSYKQSTALVVNLTVSALSIILALYAFSNFGVGSTRQSLRYILMTFAFVLLGWILSVIFVTITAFIIDFFKSTMSWYGNQWFMFGLYVAPTVACCCGMLSVWNYYNETLNLSLAAQAQIQAHVVRLIWTFFVLVGTYFEIRSVSVLLIPVIFQTGAFIIMLLLRLQYTVRGWQLIYILGTLMSSLYSMTLWDLMLTILIPICGRIGPEKNPEYIIGIATCLLTILTLSYYVPFISIVNKSSAVFKFLLGVFLITFIVVTCTPLGFPYSDNPDSPTPQRFWIYHTSRTFHDESNQAKKSSGFFVLNWDRNSPNSIMNRVKSLGRIKSIKDDCDRALLCGLPLASSRLVDIIPKSLWVPAGQPVIHEPTNLKLLSKTKISNTVTRFNFSGTGPSHMHIAVSARRNATLIATSLVDSLPKNSILWNQRPTYIVFHTWGVEATPLLFTLDFEAPENWSGPIFDIAISGRCMHDRRNVKTPQFVQFLNEFPKWADVVPFLATYESWVY